MQLPTKVDPDPCRKPDNRNENFEPGDFADFIAPIIKTLNLYQTQNIDLRVVAQQFKTLDLFHHEGIDPAAAAIALKQLAEQHPEAGLEIVALEGRGDDKVRVQAKVKGAVDRSALSADYFAAYREMSAMPYSDLQSLLGGIAEKDERIRSLENMVKTAIEGNKFYVETVYNLGDTVSEKSSININSGGGSVSGVVGGNISDVSGVVNLGTISGDVTNTIGQLPDTPDSDGPSLK
ncbi:MAG: low-complexity protein, partial [Cyanobacteria bacterium P01_C01_bin.73]